MSQPGMQPRWSGLEGRTRWRLRSGTGHLRRVWMAGTCGGCSGLDMAVASQQGRRVGLNWPVGRAMNPPTDESTSAAQQLQQLLQQPAGGRLGLNLGGSR
jgi:hypothetical protein